MLQIHEIEMSNTKLNITFAPKVNKPNQRFSLCVFGIFD